MNAEQAAPEPDHDRRDRLLDGIAAAWLWARSYDLLSDGGRGEAGADVPTGCVTEPTACSRKPA